MKKICIITLGCKVNQYESDSLSSSLIERGFSVCQKLEKSDLYIVNTCAVTNEAEKKSRMVISKIRKIDPLSTIFICGCASQANKNNFSGDNIIVLGTYKKDNILSCITSGNYNDFDLNKEEKEYYDNYFAKKQKTRSYIKIQDGCNNFCSYCIIPYLRGRERSRSLESIKKELDVLSKNSKEIIFVGINMSHYGIDFDDKKSLIDVIRLTKNYPNVRFRLSSLEMNIITDDFLKTIKESKNICEHFHLSLQSASNDVLKKMNRKYTIEEYIEKIKLIRSYFPNAGITTDLIVGFPTETEDNFNETLLNVLKIKFSDMHIFPYSKRNGTVAANYPQINGTIVKSRVNKITELKEKMKSDFLTQQIGKIFDVLVEVKTDIFFDGLSSNYVRCYFDCKKCDPGTMVKLKAIKTYKDGLFCELI